jgi:UDP-glucose 6-dehydrogenase
MRIAVIGTGQVGLLTAACLAHAGHDVIGTDDDQAKITVLIRGSIPASCTPGSATEARASFGGFDPHAAAAAGAALPGVTVAADPYSLAEEAEALVLATEWPEILDLDWGRLKRAMRRPLILDGRNALDRARLLSEGFEYLGMGR